MHVFTFSKELIYVSAKMNIQFFIFKVKRKFIFFYIFFLKTTAEPIFSAPYNITFFLN